MKAKWITPVVTALDQKGHIDIEANKRIYDFLIDGGMDGILLFGSIGEFFALSLEEKKIMIREAVKHIRHRVTLYVGTCHMEFETCVELSNYAIEQGADGVMVISPYYFNLPDSAILHFYDTLAEQVKGSVLLYNFPDRTGHDLSPELIYRLVSKHENIVGIKDTVATMGHTRAIIQKVKKEFPNFMVYSGFDEMLVPGLLYGADGCIGTWANLLPDLYAKVYARVRAGGTDAVKPVMDEFTAFLAVGWNYGIIDTFEELMRARGYAGRCFRRPSAWEPGKVEPAVLADLLARLQRLEDMAAAL